VGRPVGRLSANPAPATYADATALIGLSRIARLDLLTLLPSPTRATRRVWDEVAGDATKAGVPELLHARETGLIEVVDEGDPGALPGLDPGESTALTAAAAAGAIVLVDERKARALIAADPSLRGAIRGATGVIGLLLLGKRRGRISAVRPLLDALLAEGFWIGSAFYERILRAAGED
jgi:predicted nucleic acid-binding protein